MIHPGCVARNVASYLRRRSENLSFYVHSTEKEEIPLFPKDLFEFEDQDYSYILCVFIDSPG